MPRKESVAVPGRNDPIRPQTHTYYLELPRRTSDGYDGKCGRKFVRKMDSKSQKSPRRRERRISVKQV